MKSAMSVSSFRCLNEAAFIASQLVQISRNPQSLFASKKQTGPIPNQSV
jgi:hypothetical protein